MHNLGLNMTRNVEILLTQNFPYGGESGHDSKTDPCPTVSHPKLQNKECDMKNEYATIWNDLFSGQLYISGRRHLMFIGKFLNTSHIISV